jgi:hypothetical protein
MTILSTNRKVLLEHLASMFLSNDVIMSREQKTDFHIVAEFWHHHLDEIFLR